MDKRMIIFFFLIFFSLTQIGCVQTKYELDPLDDNYLEQIEEAQIPDPLKPINVAFFNFNNSFYKNLLNPFVKNVWEKIPQKGRKGVDNFFTNLGTGKRFLGSLLQGKFNCAGFEMGEFIINSTWGLGGIIDIVKEKPCEEEDLGQALAYWGVPEFFFINWPFFGPSTLRDSAGDAISLYSSPQCQLNEIGKLTACSTEYVSEWSLFYETYETIYENSMNPYESFKNVYTENRRYSIGR